ncbi:hypothetical protein Hanom_Chr11g01056111 [Helianthus anomalus]
MVYMVAKKQKAPVIIYKVFLRHLSCEIYEVSISGQAFAANKLKTIYYFLGIKFCL